MINFGAFLRKQRYESWVLLIVLALSWMGFGDYMSALLLLAFLVVFFYKEGRETFLNLFNDRPFIIFLGLFTLSNVVSSLFSVEPRESTLLSLLWFLVIFIPVFYSKLALISHTDFFSRVIAPVGLAVCLIILFYLTGSLLSNIFNDRAVIGRHKFVFLGLASTPDVIIMLGGIGYGYILKFRGERYRWYGLFYLLFCLSGTVISYDRGGVLAFFCMSVLLLSFDYKRLIPFLLLTAVSIAVVSLTPHLQGLTHLFRFLYSRDSIQRLMEIEQIATFQSAWQIIRDHVLLGVGTNNFSAHSEQYGTGRWFAYAHNFVLQFWAENGLFGMTFGLSIIGLVLVRWVRLLRAEKVKSIALGLGGAFIGMLVSNLTNSTIWLIKIAVPFWTLAGVIMAMYGDIRLKEEHESNGRE